MFGHAQAQIEGPSVEEPVSLSKASVRHSIHLYGTPSSVLARALEMYGLQVVVLSSIATSTRAFHLDMDDVDLPTLGSVLRPMTHCLFVPIGAHLVIAVPDDAEHRVQFQRSVAETITVPNLDNANAKEERSVDALVTGVFGMATPTHHDNQVTVRAEPALLDELRTTLDKVYRPMPQISLQIKIYMVSRTHNREFGIELPTKITIFNVLSEAEALIHANASVVQQLIDLGLAGSGDTLGIAELLLAYGYGSNSVLGSSSLYFGGGYTATGVQFGSVKANTNLSVSTTQELDDVTLRVADGSTGKFRIGESYPLVTATTSTTTESILSSSTSTAPIFQYQDLGFTLEASPHLVSHKEVLIHVHQTIRILHGSTLNNIPILDNKEFSDDLSVREGETTVITSNLSRTEARATQGLIDSIPTDSSRLQDDSQLVVTITPTVVRR